MNIGNSSYIGFQLYVKASSYEREDDANSIFVSRVFSTVKRIVDNFLIPREWSNDVLNIVVTIPIILPFHVWAWISA